MVRRAVFAFLLVAGSAGAVSSSKAESEKNLQAAAEDHDIAIDISRASTKIDSGVTCATMSDTHITISMPIFLPEMNRYPGDFFPGAGIDRMVLCGDLTRNGQKLGGLAVYKSKTFYLNLKSANLNADHAQRTFHHEVFHLVDKVDDKAWKKVTGGFVTEYAKTSTSEDRAELFAEMMVNGKGVASKSVLKQKAQLLDAWVQENYPNLHKELKSGR